MDDRENLERKKEWGSWGGLPGVPFTVPVGFSNLSDHNGLNALFSRDNLMENKQASISTKFKQQQRNSAQHFQDLLFGPTYGSDLGDTKSALRA